MASSQRPDDGVSRNKTDVGGENGLAGETRAFAAQAADAIGAAKEAVDSAADGTRATLRSLGEKAADLVANTQGASEAIDSFTAKRPYSALALAGFVGLVLGVLLFGGGPKVIYVRPARAGRPTPA